MGGRFSGSPPWDGALTCRTVRIGDAEGAIRVFLGWRQTVRFTDFMAEMGLWEFPFFIRNDNKLAFPEKNPLKHVICNTTQAADNNQVLSEENKILVWKFFKNSQFFVISNEKRKFSKHCFNQIVRETDRLTSA